MEPTNQPAPQPQPQIQTQPQVQQPVPPQQAKATVPQPATVGLLGPNLQEHDRTLRLWRLYVRIAAASFVALSMILFIAQGAQTSNIYTSSCSYYNSRYCRSYSIQTYDLVSLPIVCTYICTHQNPYEKQKTYKLTHNFFSFVAGGSNDLEHCRVHYILR